MQSIVGPNMPVCWRNFAILARRVPPRCRHRTTFGDYNYLVRAESRIVFERCKPLTHDRNRSESVLGRKWLLVYAYRQHSAVRGSWKTHLCWVPVPSWYICGKPGQFADAALLLPSRRNPVYVEGHITKYQVRALVFPPLQATVRAL